MESFQDEWKQDLDLQLNHLGKPLNSNVDHTAKAAQFSKQH